MQGVIYTRVSSDEQVKGMSLGFQRDDCERYALDKGIVVAMLFEERGESAKFADRPELVKLLDYCKKNKGRINSLIVWKLDRLSRNQMDYYFIKRTLLGYGIALHSATEPSIEDPSSIAGKVFETFSALQAEIDNSVRRDRTMRGMAAKIASGIFPWKPPLGYYSAQNRLKGLKKMEPDEPDAQRFPLIKRLFRTCLEERIVSSIALAYLANNWGLRTNAGGRIYPQSIDRILENRFYAGILINPWTKEEVQGKHEPVIATDDFFKVQMLRGRKVPRAPDIRKSEHPDFPLRRTVLCGSCTGPLTGSWSRGNGGRYPYYHCGTKLCVMYGKGIKKRDLEVAFVKKLAAVSPRRKTIDVLKHAVLETVEEDRRSFEDAARRNARQRQELEERIERLISMKERELLTDEEFLDRKQGLRNAIATLPVGRQNAIGDRSVEQALEYAGRFIADLPQEWLGMEPQLRRRFEKAVFPEGIVYVRGEGFGTARLGPIFELTNASHGSKTRLVDLVKENWNQILDELQFIATVAEERLPQHFPITAAGGISPSNDGTALQ